MFTIKHGKISIAEKQTRLKTVTYTQAAYKGFMFMKTTMCIQMEAEGPPTSQTTLLFVLHYACLKSLVSQNYV